MATQEQVNNAVNQLINNPNIVGHAVGYHGTYQGECTSPIKMYVEDLTGNQAPYMANNRADGWGSNPPAELRPFFMFESYQPGRIYPYGSIMMWNSPPDSHIALVLHSDGSNWVQVFEQNADPTGSVCGTKNREVNNRYHAANYVMIPIVQTATPPTPARPKYQITETYPQGRQIQLNKDTNLWGMNYDFDTMVKNPVETGHKQGEIWTVTNKVHHDNGYDYYRRDGQVDGFNVLDCNDYTPPPPPVYVPPAAPIKVDKVQYYDLVTTVAYYAKPEDARQDVKAIGTIDKGTYVLLKTDGTARKLTKKNTDTATYWINDYNNKVEVVPAPVVITPEIIQPTLPVDPPPVVNLPTDVADNTVATEPVNVIKPQYFWIREDRLPVRLTSTNSLSIPIHDLDGVYPVQQFPAHRTEDYSMYTVINGKEYWLPDRTRQKGWMYGILVDFLPDEEPIKATMLDRNANGKYDIIDIFDNGLQGFIETSGKYFDGIKKAVSTQAPKISQAKQRINKAVDGFSKRKP